MLEGHLAAANTLQINLWGLRFPGPQRSLGRGAGGEVQNSSFSSPLPLSAGGGDSLLPSPPSILLEKGVGPLSGTDVWPQHVAGWQGAVVCHFAIWPVLAQGLLLCPSGSCAE